MHASLEESIARTCPSCGHDHHAKFFSLFVGDMHYVIGDCDSCGYRIEIPSHDLGGGLFMPDGSVTTVKETFRQRHTEHMKGRLDGAAPVLSSFSNLRMRMTDAAKDAKK